MKKPTQKQFVIDRLKQDGFVSRNMCLQNRITRLAAIVSVLESEGWQLEPFKDEGDYCYKVIKPAMRTITKVVEREGKFYPMKIEIPIV